MIYSNLSISGASGDLSESRKKKMGTWKKIYFWLFPKSSTVPVPYFYVILLCVVSQILHKSSCWCSLKFFCQVD